MELVGLQHIDFTGKDGKQVKGVKIHFLDDTNPNVTGKAAVTLFIRADHPCYDKAIALNYGYFDIRYGYAGRIVDIFPVDKKG